jgi:sulfite exporter TauE/SafE
MFSQSLVALAGGAGLAVGFGAHCALMCGPVAVVGARRGLGSLLSYSLGRVVSYGLMGSLAGSVGRVLFASPWARGVGLVASLVLVVALGSTALRLIARERRPALVRLGRSPRVSRLGRALAALADEPLLLGAATAVLPCGALYAALGAAAALGSATQGALLMGSFAALTGLLLAGAGRLHGAFALTPGRRRVVGLLLLVGAACAAWRPVSLLFSSGAPACHAQIGSSLDRSAGPS